MYIYPLLRYAFSHALFEHPSFLCTSHIALFARNLAARVRVREEHTPVEVSCEASTVARAAIQETMAGFSHQLLAFLRSSSPALPPPVPATDLRTHGPSTSGVLIRRASLAPCSTAHLWAGLRHFLPFAALSGDAFPARCADARAVRHSLGRRVTFKSK